MGRPPAVGLPSCLHAATGMEEVGWWGDPREGFILTKPYKFFPRQFASSSVCRARALARHGFGPSAGVQTTELAIVAPDVPNQFRHQIVELTVNG